MPFNALAFGRASGYPARVKFQKIAIIGVGLLGGSIGLAVKQRRLARETAGFVRRTASLADCEQAGALDYATTDLLAAVSGADLVILCTPLAQMPAITVQLLPALKPGAVVTDVGSVKASVVRGLETLVARAGAHFVGSHPMAGAEKTGVLAARADLFVNAVCVVTPTPKSHAPSVQALAAFWKSLGACTLALTPAEHDVFVSRTSHLPHVVAAALASRVLHPQQPKTQSALCATGFRDTTRVASGSPEMWRDIALANRQNLGRAVKAFIADLETFQKALARADQSALTRFFETAKQRRDAWCACGATHSPE
jgi:prephenate dehydrogenase